MIQLDIEKIISDHIHRAIADQMANIDIKAQLRQMMQQAIADLLESSIRDYRFPEASIPHASINWKDVKISADMLDGGIIKQFNSTGIQDDATSCQLTIVDGMVVIEGSVISRKVKADDAEFKAVTVDNITINRANLGDGIRNDVRRLADERIASHDKNDIDLTDRKIMRGDVLLLDETTLGPSVINSNIRRIGTLQDLRVMGDAKFSETMLVSDQGRIGINTEEPAGAVTVWDEDAELTITKNRKRNMFLGSTRNSTISLGIANEERLSINEKEVDISGPIRVMGVKFSVSDTVPDRQGEPQEIVMVRTAAKGQPMLYICMGGSAWGVLR